MSLTRRSLLRHLAGAGTFCAFFSPFGPAAQATSAQIWFAGARLKDGNFGLLEIDQDLQTKLLFQTEQRLHGISLSPDGQWLVAPARRAGDQLFVYHRPSAGLDILRTKTAHHYYGHGCFSPDGRLYLSTQNDYEQEKGCVVVHDVRHGFQELARYDSGGIGPHEMELCPKTGQAIIANGGILTHPDLGRAKLNVDSMAPNLSRLDLHSGQIMASAELAPAHHQLSLRHLTVSDQGCVYVGAQDQAGIRAEKPLVWSWTLNETTLTPMARPAESWARYRGYIGSIQLDHTQTSLAVTSPRGHVCSVWDLTKKTAPQHISSKDVCGLAPTGRADEFLITNGAGQLELLKVDEKALHRLHQSKATLAFDNHLCAFL